MQIVIVIAAIAVVLYFVFRKRRVNASTNEVKAFMDQQIAPGEFYERLENIVRGLDMPDVQMESIAYPTNHFLSDRREYLRISRKDSIFDVCVSPFGKGSFVSYWFGEPRKALKELTAKMANKYINNSDVHEIIDNFNTKTRYQYDTDSVFKVWVKDCINTAIAEFQVEKGVRVSLETA